jgi:predicted ATPase
MIQLHHHLTHLEAAGLVRLAREQPDLEYLFRHALVQDAAYAVLLLSDRKQLHQAVAETLERTYKDRPQEIAPLLAHHFDAAGNNSRALHYAVANPGIAGPR